MRRVRRARLRTHSPAPTAAEVRGRAGTTSDRLGSVGATVAYYGAMRVFYALCLVLATAYHLAALGGIMNPQAPPQHYSPLLLVFVAFILAVSTHPKSKGHSQGLVLTWQDAVAHVEPRARWLSVAAFTYGFLLCYAAIQRAQARLGTDGGVTTEQLGPVGITALGLALGAVSWLAGVSGQNLKAELIRRGEWFR